MNIKKRMVVIGSSLALTGVLAFANPTTTKAAEYTPETWVARTVQEVKNDLVGNENNSNYLLIWGDTLSVISEATGIPIQTLAEINHIANRDFILAGNSIYLSGESMDEDTWSSMQEAIDFYEGNIIADNGEEVGEVALGIEFYNRDSWKLISHSGDTIVLSLANEGRGGRDIIEFVKGKEYTTLTYFIADSPYPEQPTQRRTVQNSDLMTVQEEEL